jgi:hypothetical protein
MADNSDKCKTCIAIIICKNFIYPDDYECLEFYRALHPPFGKEFYRARRPPFGKTEERDCDTCKRDYTDCMTMALKCKGHEKEDKK